MSRPQTRPCAWCKQPFTPRYGPMDIYCSDICSRNKRRQYEAEYKKRKEQALKSGHMRSRAKRICAREGCGKQIPDTVQGIARYCSRYCQNKAYHETYKARMASRAPASTLNTGPSLVTEKPFVKLSRFGLESCPFASGDIRMFDAWGMDGRPPDPAWGV